MLHGAVTGPDSSEGNSSPGHSLVPAPRAASRDFLGDTGIPVEPGHYSDHPAPGVSFNLQVSFRPAK